MLTVYLTPELETEIRETAVARGQDTNQYISQLITQALRMPLPAIIPAQVSNEEILRRWKAKNTQAQQFTEAEIQDALNAPAYRREDIYEDDGR